MRAGWWKSLYVQVLVAIVAGVLLGYFDPGLGAALKPLGDAFIALVKMIIGPVIFLTVTLGISQMGDLKKVGRVGFKAVVYFEVLTTIALAIGLLVANGVAPGVGMHIDPASLDAAAVADYKQKAEAGTGVIGFLLDIIPKTFVSAFIDGNLLQVLLVALLAGVALNHSGAAGDKVQRGLEHVSKVFFGIVHLIMKLAPVGAFGAMAFTIGKYGIGTLVSLGWLLASVYLTCLLFIVRGARERGALFRLFAVEIPALHPRRAGAGARHLLLGIGAAAPGRAARGTGLRPGRGRAGGAHRLFLQPRRHLHLPHHGGGLHRPGARHPAGPVATSCCCWRCCC